MPSLITEYSEPSESPMFYDAIRNDHGLRHDPFKALLAPRPIGWISTIDIDGRPNLAPYSFFGASPNSRTS